MTKNGRSFDLPILDLHHELLMPMRGLSREWVFPAPKSRVGHLECPKRINWPLHSHRRTFTTVAMEAGVLEEIVGRLLNHTPLRDCLSREFRQRMGHRLGISVSV
jgi:hypothetical protein